jgi:hypothetical protein
VAYVCNPSYVGGIGRKTQFNACMGKQFEALSKKIPKEKIARAVAQVASTVPA